MYAFRSLGHGPTRRKLLAPTWRAGSLLSVDSRMCGPPNSGREFSGFSALLPSSPHHGPPDPQHRTDCGDGPERRQDYSSNHGASPFGSDQPGATQLRVSESVAALGFLSVGGWGRRQASPRAVRSGSGTRLYSLWVQSFLLKRRSTIAKQHPTKKKSKKTFLTSVC